MSKPNPTHQHPWAQFEGRVKIYSDGADRASMLEMAAHPLISGLTTNPSLMKKAGVKDYRAYAKEILSEIKTKPISFEVFADDAAEMKRQALEIATWGKNVYVKIPITNSLGESCIPLIRELSHQNISLNVTALFSLEQIWNTCQALKDGAPSIVSVFAGRIADAGVDPMPIMTAASAMCRETCNGKGTMELLWASTREPFNVVQAEKSGCEIITVPPEMIKKLSAFGKSLLQGSLETVKGFKTDSDAAGFSF